MSAQVHSLPGQTEGRRTEGLFLEETWIDLSPKLYLTYGGNVNI